jgi:hypothetical protein
MSNFNFHKKTISDKVRYGGEIIDTTFKIVSQPTYTTGSENVILVKSIDICEITLDSTNSNHLIIKSLTSTVLKPSIGEIDEFYTEISMERGACVELLVIDGNWYVISSDGLKLN